MEEKMEIMNLLQSRHMLEKELESLVYGAVEIRENNGKQYLYAHYREEGVALTKYVGEYSEELYQLILNNSMKAKELKKQIREIGKRLKQLNYVEEELSEKVQQNIDFAKRYCKIDVTVVKYISNAGMMELADVLDSKSSGSDTVRVRPPLPALTKNSQVLRSLGAFLYCK